MNHRGSVSAKFLALLTRTFPELDHRVSDAFTSVSDMNRSR